MNRLTLIIVAFVLLIKSNLYGSKVAEKCRDDSIRGVKVESISAGPRLNDYLKLLESGDECAIKIYFRLRNKNKEATGMIEMLDVSFGRSIKNNPKGFLSGIYEDRTEKWSDLEGVLCNLGNGYVDDFQAQSEEINRRIKALSTIKSNNLALLKNQCIRVLQRYEMEVSEALKSGSDRRDSSSKSNNKADSDNW